MAVDETYTDPSTGGAIDLNTGQTLTETVWDKVLSNLKHIGHTAGLTWVGFTPTLTQSGSVTVTVTRARYSIVGKTAIVQIALAVTGSGTGGNDISIGSIPAAITPAATGANMACGAAIVSDASVANYACTASMLSGPAVKFFTYNAAGYVGTAPSFALANTDSISCQLVYEIT